MKKILLFCLLFTSYALQSQTVDDFARWRVGMQIGSKSSPMAKGITNRVVTSPAADTLVTSRGVYNWVTGTLTFAGDVSGPYNNLALANTAVTPGIYTNATVTVDAKGRVTLISSGTSGATYTAGTGIAIDGSNVISNTAPNIVQTTITGNAGTATALQTPRTINGVAFDGSENITLPASEVPLTFSQGVTRTVNDVKNDLITGKAGGQTIVGGTSSGENLTLSSTSNATKGYVGITDAVRATANFGSLSIGNGPFDGSTSGFFAGAAAGTRFAINMASGSTADFVNYQLFGADRFKISSSGQVLVGNGTASLPPYSFSGGSGTGLYAISNNVLGVSFSTSVKANWSSTGLRLGDGSAAASALQVIGTTNFNGSVICNNADMSWTGNGSRINTTGNANFFGGVTGFWSTATTNQNASINGNGGASTNTYFAALSGNVGIGTTSPAATALLDVTSTTKGFLAPRMTTTQRDAISSPAEGLIIYNLTAHKLNVYTGSAWETITSL